jgi:DUF4097 and DUF4098 domain-containing protein YvlB
MKAQSPILRTLAAAAIVALLGAGLHAQQQTETVDRTVALPENGTLELKNFSGKVRITGTSGKDVVIHAVRRARRDRLENIKLTIETTGSRVIVNANDRQREWRERDENVVETDFEIQVPAAAKLDVNVFGSDVTISGVSGSQRIKSFSGDVIVSDARGAIDAESFSSTIEINAIAAGASPDIRAETFSGDIRVRLAENAQGSVQFDSFSGSFDTALPMKIRSVRRSRTEGDLPGGAGRTLRFHTFSGNVRIDR